MPHSVLICGRLGVYKYYDMDHAIARAQTLSHRILAGNNRTRNRPRGSVIR